MRCPNCNTLNDEGAALCENCAEPLTAYGGQITGMVSEETREKIERLSVRPPVVPVMAALDALAAFVWPFAAAWAAFAHRTVANAAGTNYIGAAFGSLGAVFTAAVMIPLGVALLVIAWATWTQRPWAWIANAVVLVLAALLAFFAFPSAPVSALLRIGLAGALAYFWFQPDTKDWYGMR
jgi:hypothetical protein